MKIRHPMHQKFSALFPGKYLLGSLNICDIFIFILWFLCLCKNFSSAKINSFMLNFYLNCEQSNAIDQWISFAITRGVGRNNLLFLEKPFLAHHHNPHPDPSKRYTFTFDLFLETNASTPKYLRLECSLICHPTNCDFI